LCGGFTSESLYIGEALAPPLASKKRAVGLIMGFGAGTRLSAIAYELIPESSFEHGRSTATGFVLGALAYYFADRIIDGNGGRDRQQTGSEDANGGSGAAMFLGALLDGLPEAFILGITIALGGTVSIAFVTAVFMSNIRRAP
jgi:ZIP family zinc transporter